MSKLRPAIALSFAAQYTTDLMALVTVVILVRILTPEEIGLFSLAFVLVELSQELRNFGISQYVIQRPDLTYEKMRSALGLMFLMACGIAAVLVAASAPVAAYYDEPGLRSVLRVMAILFLIIPFGAVTQGYLVREMEFNKLYRVRVAASLAYSVTVLTLAFLGFSYMSMAWASVLSAAVSVGAVNYYRPRCVPLLPAFRGLREVISFGASVSAAGLLRKLGEGLPELIVGRLLNMAAVGYLSRAIGLVGLFNRAVILAVRPVVLPHFSRQQREQADMEGHYLRAVSHTSAVAWPFYGFVALMAYPVVRILYGDQWDAAVPIAQILCAWGAVRALCCFATEVVIASGKVGRALVKEAIVVPAGFALIVAGSSYGLAGVAGAMAGIGLLELLVSSYLIYVTIGASLPRILKAAGKSLPIAALAVAVPGVVFLKADIGPDNVWVPLLVAAVGAGAGWLLGVFLTRHALAEEITGVWIRFRGSMLARGAG